MSILLPPVVLDTDICLAAHLLDNLIKGKCHGGQTRGTAHRKNIEQDKEVQELPVKCLCTVQGI